MKTIRWIMFVMVFFTVTKGFATKAPKLDVINIQTKKALVIFSSEKPTLFEMTLQNGKGEIICYKKSENPLNEYRKEFDFSELGNGMYTICMNYGNYSVNRELFVSEHKICVGPKVLLYEPYFCLENGVLNVSFLNVSQKNVFLNFYQDGRYITGICLGNDMSLQKRIDLTNLKDGKYKLVLTDWFKDHPFVVQK